MQGLRGTNLDLTWLHQLAVLVAAILENSRRNGGNNGGNGPQSPGANNAGLAGLGVMLGSNHANDTGGNHRNGGARPDNNDHQAGSPDHSDSSSGGSPSGHASAAA